MTASKQIKLFLVPPDHDRVRLAAAFRRTTMANFCRELVVAEAKRLADNIKMPEEPRKRRK